MSTKQNPGAADCYAKAGMGEEMFILLSRDPMAPSLIELWAEVRAVNGEGHEVVSEAQATAQRMRDQLLAMGRAEINCVDYLADTLIGRLREGRGPT